MSMKVTSLQVASRTEIRSFRTQLGQACALIRAKGTDPHKASGCSLLSLERAQMSTPLNRLGVTDVHHRDLTGRAEMTCVTETGSDDFGKGPRQVRKYNTTAGSFPHI